MNRRTLLKLIPAFALFPVGKLLASKKEGELHPVTQFPLITGYKYRGRTLTPSEHIIALTAQRHFGFTAECTPILPHPAQPGLYAAYICVPHPLPDYPDNWCYSTVYADAREVEKNSPSQVLELWKFRATEACEDIQDLIAE